MQLAGAGVGGYLGYRATGTMEGTLGGAGLGMLLGGIGATTYNLLRPCFAAGTPIRTAEGSKPIEEVVAGDYVLSRDENDPDGPVLLKVVEETYVRTGRIWVLRIGGREIRTTGEHPFYARGKGWTAVAELDTTDVLLSEDGRWLPIEALEDTGSYETVYNFRVANFHTYFVGGDGWDWSIWTHNATCVHNADGTVTIILQYKSTWSRAERIAAEVKVAVLNDHLPTALVVPTVRVGNAQRTGRRVMNLRGTGADADHILDLQLGGADDLTNIMPLLLSPNRSLGPQIADALGKLTIGTIVRNFILR